jgi:predicted ester cyclase
MHDNEVTVRRFFDELWSDGRIELADELLAPQHRHHVSGRLIEGRDAVKEMARDMLSAFPDLRFDIEDALAVDDKVLIRWTGMDLVRLEDGRIVELWAENDALGLSEQLHS